MSKDTYPYNLLKDIKGEPFGSVLTNDQMNGLEYALNQLKEREKEAILLRYKDNQTFSSIGRKFGFSSPNAQKIIYKALRKLRYRSLFKRIFDGLVSTQEFEQKQREVDAKGSELKQRWLTLMCEQELLMRETAEYKNLAEKFHINTDPFVESLGEMKTNRSFYSLIKIEELELPSRVYICVKRAGRDSVDQLMEMTVDDLRAIRGLGRKSIDEIVDKVLNFTGHDIRENY